MVATPVFDGGAVLDEDVCEVLCPVSPVEAAVAAELMQTGAAVCYYAYSCLYLASRCRGEHGCSCNLSEKWQLFLDRSSWGGKQYTIACMKLHSAHTSGTTFKSFSDAVNAARSYLRACLQANTRDVPCLIAATCSWDSPQDTVTVYV